jgi:SAM-dependent methyltransferase
MTGERLQRIRRPAWLGTVRRTRPLSDNWGRDRGTPIDRYYIERFLAAHRSDIRGRVIEVADLRYTEQFGEGVAAAEVLDIDADNPKATLISDIASPEHLPQSAFDCAIVTQTLQYVFDLDAAARGIHRLLAPGGVALLTIPSVSRIAPSAGLDGEFWRFTSAGCARLFGNVFGERVDARSYGNVLVAVAFLLGMACEELSTRELSDDDPYFPVLVAVRAQKLR